MPEPVPLHRNRNFLLLWSGQAISVIGSRISSIAYPLLVLALTNSPTAAGVVGFLATLPNLLFQLPAGALVDRWNRKRVMVMCDLGRLVVITSIVVAFWAGRLTLPQLMVVAFLEGTLFVFFGLAEDGAIRHVVPFEQIPLALSQNEARARAAWLIGQPLGGALFGVRPAFPFLADAISYTVSLLTLVLIRGEFNEPRAATGRNLGRDVLDGISWLWQHGFLRVTALLVAGSNFLFQALILTLIVTAKEHGASSSGIGIMLGCAGVGGVLGAVLAPRIQQRVPARLVVVSANWIWVLLMPLIALVSSPYGLGGIFGLMAFVGPVWNVVIGAYRIRIVPDAMLGRVKSATRLVAWGAEPLGSLTAGLLLSSTGSFVTTLMLTIGMLSLAVIATTNASIRRGPALGPMPAHSGG